MKDMILTLACFSGVFVALAMGGCKVSASVTPNQWEAAVNLCEQNGGVRFMRGFSDRIYVQCKNGAVFKGYLVEAQYE